MLYHVRTWGKQAAQFGRHRQMPARVRVRAGERPGRRVSYTRFFAAFASDPRTWAGLPLRASVRARDSSLPRRARITARAMTSAPAAEGEQREGGSSARTLLASAGLRGTGKTHEKTGAGNAARWSMMGRGHAGRR